MLAVVSAVALVALIVHELRTDEPIVDLRRVQEPHAMPPACS